MTHCFALGTLLGREGDAELVDHGVSALAQAFRDADHDGWYGHLDAEGVPTTTAKTMYEHAFVLLASSSATLARRPGARELLDAAVAVVDAHFWDDEAGAFVEEWDREWSALSEYRGANANMHGVEACLAVHGATGDGRWLDRALRIAGRIVDTDARGNGWRLPELFDAAWTMQPEYNRDKPADPFRPYGATPGHGLEWSRLMLDLRAELELAGREVPGWLEEAAAALYARAVEDGWVEPGGFVYTTDWSGKPVVENRFHWVVAEAIGAAAALHKVTGDERYVADEARFWDYARGIFVEPAGIGWIHEVDADGEPVTGTWSGRPDTYHAAQATLIPRMPLAPALAAALAAGTEPHR